MNIISLGVYRHYKGNKYEVVGFAKHSETLEDMVIYKNLTPLPTAELSTAERTFESADYKALYGEKSTWVRPLSMWSEEIEVDGKIVKRFEYEG